MDTSFENYSHPTENDESSSDDEKCFSEIYESWDREKRDFYCTETGIKPYNELNVTTMTTVGIINQKIKKLIAFHFIKWSESDTSTIGCIRSLAVLSKNGIVRMRGDQIKKAFKNCVNIVIDIGKKMNMKLSEKKIQITGALSLEDSTKGCKILIDNIKYANKMINKIQNNKDMVEWLMIKLKGNECKRDVVTYSEESKIYIVRKDRLLDFNIKKLVLDNNFLVDTVTNENILIPDNYDLDFINYLLFLSTEHIYYNDLYSKLEFALNTENIYDAVTDICIDTIKTVMVNHNYNLGYNVKRPILDELMSNNSGGFISLYDPGLFAGVKIEKSYIPDIIDNTKKNKKTPKYSFIVYGSGSVTQSGPNKEKNEIEYVNFMTEIKKIEDLIKA